MDDLRFILNMPIQVDQIGIIYPFTMEDYALHSDYFSVLTITTNLLLQQIDVKLAEERAEILKSVKNFDVVCLNDSCITALLQLLKLSFKTDQVAYHHIDKVISINDSTISRSNYDYIRNSILQVNNIRLPKQANNKELQSWFDKSYKLRSNQNKKAGDMEDIITSIMAFTGYTPEDIKKMTVYQINKLIARLNKISEYETNIQFLCVGAEKIQLEHWSNKIDDSKDDICSDFDSFTHSMESLLL